MTGPPADSEPPLADLRHALSRLRREQGDPSLRAIASATGDPDVAQAGQLSHTTVGVVLRCKTLPAWPRLRRVVTALDGDVGQFRRLWVKAKDDQERPPAAAASAPPRRFATPFTVVDEADLGPMELIAKGTAGDVFRVTEHTLRQFSGRLLAFKMIAPKIRELSHGQVARSMERAVALREAMRPAEQSELDRFTVWPLAVVQRDGETIGTVMPLIPADFMTSVDAGGGQPSYRVHEFVFLSAADDYIAKLGIDRSMTGNRFVRLSLVAQLSYAVSLLHRHDIIFGDLSLKNIAIAVNPPRLMLLDCDGAAALADEDRAQLHSPWFMPPEISDHRQTLQDHETDVYKLALCILRGLTSGRGVTQLSDPAVLAGSLSQDGIRLLTRALSADRSERPTAHQISLYLLGQLANQIASASAAQPQPSPLPTYVPPPVPPPRFSTAPIYVSYQRPEPHAALLLTEYLSDYFGNGSVFINVGGFDPGTNIPEATAQAVSRCRIMLVVIGPSWLTLSDSTDVPCIMDGDDPLRIELECAFERNLPVIPVLLDDARRPRAAQLPPSLVGLAQKSESTVRSSTFKNDVAALADQLDRMFPRTDAEPVMLGSFV